MEFGALIGALMTGLREGVEAALIVGIILAYLAQTGNREHFPKIWAGTVAAFVLSALLGVVLFIVVGEFQAPYEQLFEAATMVLAAAVLTWMLFWMRRQARSVKGELQAAVDRHLSSGGGWSLAFLAFTAIIREGIETSLFLLGQVTGANASEPGSGWTVLVGAAIGIAIAAVLGWMIYVGARRINYGTFFRWTGLVLVFVAAGLVSRAVHELVEIGAIQVGSQPALNVAGVLPDESPLGAFLHALFGYSATPELVTLVVYLLYLVPVLYLYLRPVRVATPAERRAATTG